MIDRGEVPALVPHVAVASEVEAAGELTAIVEVKDHGGAQGVSGVDGREGVVVQEETVDPSLGIDGVARNLTGVVNAEGRDLQGIRDNDRREHTLCVPHVATALRSSGSLTTRALETPRMRPLSSMSFAKVDVPPGASIVVKTPWSRRNPWYLPAASRDWPTIWPRLLMPFG